MKKNYGLFFSYYRVSQTSLDYLEGSTSYSGNYRGSYKIIFLGPMRLLKTQIFEKNSILPMKKNFRLLFFVISSVENTTGQLIIVQKVFRQKL